MSAHRWIRKSLRRMLLAGEMPYWLKLHSRSSYVIQAVLATPEWVDRKALTALARERNRITQATGIVHVLDHRVPLSSRYVCGLNVPWNIQIIPAKVNAYKSNRWCEGQIDFFSEPEQLRLI